MTAPHGTPTRYNAGCHCSSCRAANTARQARQRVVRATYPFEIIPHGENGYSNYRCRCSDCIEAGRVKNARYRANRRAREGMS